MKYIFLMLLSYSSIALSGEDYNAGSSLGKESRGSGVANIFTFSPSESISTFTNDPKEAKKYGGIKQGTSSLANDGAAEAQTNEASQTVNESVSKNPKAILSMDAPFIKPGLEVQSGAADIISGTNADCSQKVLTKSTFTNRTCERELDVSFSCSRTASMNVESHTYYETQVFTYTGTMSQIYHNGKYIQIAYSPVVSVKGIIKNIDVTYNKAFLGVTNTGMGTYFESIVNGVVIKDNWLGCSSGGYEGCAMKHDPKMSGSVAKNITGSGTYISTYADLLFSYPVNNLSSYPGLSIPIVLGYKGFSQTNLKVTVTVTIDVEKTSYTSSVAWAENCPVDKGNFVQTASECTEPGGYRTQLVGDTEVKQYSDCWHWVDTYSLADGGNGTCSSLMNDPACTLAATACSAQEAGKCTHEVDTYQCQSSSEAVGMLCGGSFFCESGDCAEVSGSGENDFNKAVSSLAALANAASSAQSDMMPIKTFSGKALSCRKTGLGFSNCCKDSGWGQGIGLAHCNDKEKELGAAKEKNLVVSLGDKCTKKLPGGYCVKKESVYCVFDSKLGRIIQTQGRRDQLGISFGSAKDPDCRGITPDELQRIDFNRVDFYDFYKDLNDNKSIPNQSVLEERIKQQISQKMAGK